MTGMDLSWLRDDPPSSAFAAQPDQVREHPLAVSGLLLLIVIFVSTMQQQRIFQMCRALALTQRDVTLLTFAHAEQWSNVSMAADWPQHLARSAASSSHPAQVWSVR